MMQNVDSMEMMQSVDSMEMMQNVDNMEMMQNVEEEKKDNTRRNCDYCVLKKARKILHDFINIQVCII